MSNKWKFTAGGKDITEAAERSLQEAQFAPLAPMGSFNPLQGNEPITVLNWTMLPSLQIRVGLEILWSGLVAFILRRSTAEFRITIED